GAVGLAASQRAMQSFCGARFAAALGARGAGRVARAAADQGESAASELRADSALYPGPARWNARRASRPETSGGARRGRALPVGLPARALPLSGPSHAGRRASEATGVSGRAGRGLPGLGECGVEDRSARSAYWLEP